MKCPNPKCGAIDHESGAKFCHKCGAKLQDSRFESGVLTFKEPLQEREDTEYIIIHHSAVITSHTLQDIHKWHLNKGWAGIGYHYFIDKNGKVFNGRPVNTIGAHAKDGGYNRNSIAVCFEGDFRQEKMKDVQLSNNAIQLLGLLIWTYQAKILFCDELKGYKDKPVNGFDKEKIRDKAQKYFGDLYQEGMNLYGTDNYELFMEGLEQAKEKFGI